MTGLIGAKHGKRGWGATSSLSLSQAIPDRLAMLAFVFESRPDAIQR